jgi:hypothetical protein
MYQFGPDYYDQGLEVVVRDGDLFDNRRTQND